ncbi:hypothetical protein D3C80_918620 [compost metagenome]
MQRQRQGTGIRPQARRQHGQRRPYQFRYCPQGVEQQTCSTLQRPTETPGRRQGYQQAEHHREQRAQARHRQGFQGALGHRAQMLRAQVRAEKARRISAHLP